MTMTKAELITDLKSNFPLVTDSAIAVVQAEDSNGVTWYLINVFDTGSSLVNKKPTAVRKNVHFYVYHEGQVDESAFYDRDEIAHEANSDISTGSTLSGIYKIYSNNTVKGRVQAAIIYAAQDVISEAPETVNHAKRLIWAGKALSTATTYVDIMSSFVALNPTIQAAGGLATDNDIKYVVNSNVENVITILGL